MKTATLIGLLFSLTLSAQVMPTARRIAAPAASAAEAAATVIEFDGTDDSISVAGVNTADTTYSIVAWVRPASFTSSYGTIIDTTSDLGCYVRSSQLVGFFTSGGAHYSASSLSAATWVHIAFVNSSGTWNVYLNGSSDNNGTGAGTIGSLARIGSNTAGAEAFDGRVAQLAVFSTAISGTDVSNLYAGTTDPNTIGNCLAWWKMDDIPNGESGDGDSFVDSSGNGNTGTGSDGANNTGLEGVTADY